MAVEEKNLEKELIRAFIYMTSWFETRNKSNHRSTRYEICTDCRRIDMKYVFIDLYEQNSSQSK